VLAAFFPFAALLAVALADVRVTTLAGNGVAGVVDGPATQAEFVMPSGVAWGPGGELYVADSAGQRIRIVAHGFVGTLAGGGALLADGEHVAGGYRDGVASDARFNRPFGVAVGPDRAVYVADEFNHCIRRVAGGRVTTFAGSQERKGSVDGPRDRASFSAPKALAFDGDGNLYVADFNVGVRMIARDGSVTTLPASGPKTVSGVAAFGRGPSLVVYAAELAGLAIYRGDAHVAQYVSEATRPLGFPYGVAAIDEQQALFADPRQETVRFFRAGDPPFYPGAFSRALTPIFEAGNLSAGFADGPLVETRFDAPLAVAIGPDGTVAVADAGNRRIRVFPLMSTRRPVGARIDEFTSGGDAYRIVVIGNSNAFDDALWDDSFSGLLEARLSADRASIGLTKPPRVSLVVIASASLSETLDYIDNDLVAGSADLLVWEVNLSHLKSEIDRSKTGPTGGNPALDETTVVERARATIVRLQKIAAQRRMKLFFAVQPSGAATGPLEDLALRDVDTTPFYSDAQVAAFDRQLIDLVKASGVPYAAALDEFIAYERNAHPRPLYLTDDPHIAPAGNAFFARVVGDALERLRPWNR